MRAGGGGANGNENDNELEIEREVTPIGGGIGRFTARTRTTLSARSNGMYLSTEKSGNIYFGWVFFLISLGSPHARPMGRTCGESDEIGCTPHGGGIERLGARTRLRVL